MSLILTVRWTADIFCTRGNQNENLFDDRFIADGVSSDHFGLGNRASWNRHFVRSVETCVGEGRHCEIRNVESSFAALLEKHIVGALGSWAGLAETYELSGWLARVLPLTRRGGCYGRTFPSRSGPRRTSIPTTRNAMASLAQHPPVTQTWIKPK